MSFPSLFFPIFFLAFLARSPFLLPDSFSYSLVAARHRPSITTEMLICSGWKILVVPVSQPETPGRDKRGSFVAGLATGTKRCCQRHVAGAPFCPG